MKLLDFGIAKLVEQGSAESTALTQAVGDAFTPEYASPEQMLGEPLTTACDVYSLGVLLFELLADVRPYRLASRSRAALEEAISRSALPRPARSDGFFERFVGAWNPMLHTLNDFDSQSALLSVAQLERSAAPGLRVAAIHHPIFASPGGFWGNEVPLLDQGKVLQRLRTLGFSLVFHGHTHFAGVHEHRIRIMNHPGASLATQGDRISSILTVACA